MAIRAARKIQLGKEATAGTAVPATAIWRGEADTIEDTREIKPVPEDVGIIPGTDRVMVSKLGAKVKLPATPATFEQLPYILEAGVKKITTGSADGSGSGKIYDYLWPTTQANTVQTFTIETGDDQQVEEMEYSFVEEFELSGKAGEALTVSAGFAGRQATVSSFTGALSLQSVEEIQFGNGKLYIDDVPGTIGTTQKSNTFLAMSLKAKTGLAARYTADGALTFSSAKLGQPEITLDITFEHDGVATAEKAAWRNKSPRQIRVLFEGSALTTAGTYSKRTLRIDLWGKWQKFGTLDEQDGNDVVTGTFLAKYNSTKANFADMLVVNEVANIA